jgi:hypothetical protein
MRLMLRGGCWGGWGLRTSSCGWVVVVETRVQVMSKRVRDTGPCSRERSRHMANQWVKDVAMLRGWEGADGFGDEGQPPSWTREPRSMHMRYLHLFRSINMIG